MGLGTRWSHPSPLVHTKRPLTLPSPVTSAHLRGGSRTACPSAKSRGERCGGTAGLRLKVLVTQVLNDQLALWLRLRLPGCGWRCGSGRGRPAGAPIACRQGPSYSRRGRSRGRDLGGCQPSGRRGDAHRPPAPSHDLAAAFGLRVLIGPVKEGGPNHHLTQSLDGTSF